MKKTIAAYVMDKSVDWLRASDIMKLDILYYAFSTVENGKPGLYGLKRPALIANMRKLNPNLKVVVSIGGWGAGGFSEAAMTAEGREIFTRAAIDMVRAYDFDGIDMDWEYPGSSAGGIGSHPDDKYNFTYMLESLRNGLEAYGHEIGRKMHLSAALGAGRYALESIEPEKVGKLLDVVNLMTYDMRMASNSAAGHHTNLYPQTGNEAGMSIDLGVKLFTEAGIPVEKLVLGAAFYARVWKNTPGFNQPAAEADTMRFTEIERYCLPSEKNNTGYTRYWDEQAQAAYLYNGKDFLSYDDEESIACKCRYVVKKNMAGIMFWEYGNDRTYRLLNTMTNPENWDTSKA